MAEKTERLFPNTIVTLDRASDLKFKMVQGTVHPSEAPPDSDLVHT
jgi:hypothetical protein